MTQNTTLKFFVYCRKSSEDKRQIASIPDQVSELRMVSNREHFLIATEPLTEEKTAKEPGRPVFNDMLARIDRGEANAILCWDIDRLYRNPIDEGRVRWLLQQGIIQQIRTPFRVFFPQDAGLLMSIEGGRAIDYIINLKKGVARGFRGKLAKGHRPGKAPPGYLNDTTKEPGERDILPDRERFELVRRGWDLMLTGQHSVDSVQRIAADEWGLRSRKTARAGGRPYSKSMWHRIFTDTFYAGAFWWKVPETDEYKLFQGAHVPMVSWEEFDRVQFILGRTNRPRPGERRFPFSGMIRCADCQTVVTAESKYQIICPGCRVKFSATNKTACPTCTLEITQMTGATHLHYTYYHCTKMRNRQCIQKSVRAEELDRQVDEMLAQFTIAQQWLPWLFRAQEADTARDVAADRRQDDSLRHQRDQLRRQLAYINSVILSPDTDWTLISRDEIKEEKLRLLKELTDIEKALAAHRAEDTGLLELTERTFQFAAYARFWFREGSLEQRRDILAGLDSNLTLADKKLLLKLKKPLQLISELTQRELVGAGTFEPENTGARPNIFRPSRPLSRAWLRGRDEVRTYWAENIMAKPLPKLPIPPSSRWLL